MTQLENIVDQANPNLEQYAAFTRECRKLISQGISSGSYPELRPNTRRGFNDGSGIFLHRARVNIIGRPTALTKTGTRNLSLGRLEVVVVVTAQFNYSSDYRGGFDLSSADHSLRFCIGQEWGAYDALAKAMVAEYHQRKPTLLALLSQGNYSAFVEQALATVNNPVHDFKIALGWRPTQPF